MEGPCVGVPNPLGGPVVHAVSLGWECSAHPLRILVGFRALKNAEGYPEMAVGKKKLHALPFWEKRHGMYSSMQPQPGIRTILRKPLRRRIRPSYRRCNSGTVYSKKYCL
ncbi:hypothetical protein ACFX1Q_032123 [Malus domestica]